MIFSWLFGALSPVNHSIGIISGLKETFIKRYIAERTNKAVPITPEEQNEKTESCRKNLWKEIQLKGP